MPFPWFFILFIIYNIDVIVLKCYPGWLPSKTSWPTMGYSSFIWEGPRISFLWDLIGDTGGFATCVGLFWVVGHWSELCSSGLGLGGLFSFWGLSKKPVILTILSSVSVSRSSRVQVFFFGYGELDLGNKSKFLATFASHDVALCSSLLLFSSSKLKLFSEGGVIDSLGGIFSLSESMHSGSSKYFGLYSCSIGLGTVQNWRWH